MATKVTAVTFVVPYQWQYGADKMCENGIITTDMLANSILHTVHIDKKCGNSTSIETNKQTILTYNHKINEVFSTRFSFVVFFSVIVIIFL